MARDFKPESQWVLAATGLRAFDITIQNAR